MNNKKIKVLAYIWIAILLLVLIWALLGITCYQLTN